jgi:pimeloyl-ACP methyl ester carboxylesterase
MPTIVHNGVKLAYESRGKGRPAFLFVHGWTVGAGHFNMMEVPDQVNAMIAAFLRHHV